MSPKRKKQFSTSEQTLTMQVEPGGKTSHERFQILPDSHPPDPPLSEDMMFASGTLLSAWSSIFLYQSVSQGTKSVVNSSVQRPIRSQRSSDAWEKMGENRLGKQ